MKQIIISGTAASGKTDVTDIITYHAYNKPFNEARIEGWSFRKIVWHASNMGCDVVVFDEVNPRDIPAIITASYEHMIDVIAVTDVTLSQLFEHAK